MGYGGLPNEDGVVELDASCMHGPTRRGGAVGAMRGIKTPSKIAKLVMAETDHMMLVGEGALRFAKAFGFKEEDLLTERSRLAWLLWKRDMRDPNGHTNWESGHRRAAERRRRLNLAELKKAFPDVGERTARLGVPGGGASAARHHQLHRPERKRRDVARPPPPAAWRGRSRAAVGDSPIIGGGLWLDQDVGGAGSTGRGEENLRVCGAHTVRRESCGTACRRRRRRWTR